MCALIPLFGLMVTSVLGFKVITKKQWIPQIYIWYDICQLTFQAGVKTRCSELASELQLWGIGVDCQLVE